MGVRGVFPGRGPAEGVGGVEEEQEGLGVHGGGAESDSGGEDRGAGSHRAEMDGQQQKPHESSWQWGWQGSVFLGEGWVRSRNSVLVQKCNMRFEGWCRGNV